MIIQSFIIVTQAIFLKTCCRKSCCSSLMLLMLWFTIEAKKSCAKWLYLKEPPTGMILFLGFDGSWWLFIYCSHLCEYPKSHTFWPFILFWLCLLCFKYLRRPHSNGSPPKYWEIKFCSVFMLLERVELQWNFENLQDSGCK